MSRHTPTVSHNHLFDPAQPGSAIRLDTPAWRAWLEAPTTTRFAYPLFDPVVGYNLGVMTVRKEHRQRGGAYWTVYRRAGRRLRKIYVGPTPAVTQSRLQAIAEALRCGTTAAAEPDQPP